MRTSDTTGSSRNGRRLTGYIVLIASALFATVHATAAATPVAPGIAYEQRLGEVLPRDIPLQDETGAHVRFGDTFGARAAVLVFGYSRCPQLCAVVSNATVETLRALRASAGRDFTVLYVSIDPTDTPRDLAALKQRDVGRYGRTGAEPGWHYLRGDARAVRQLTAAAGFHFTYDEQRRLYAHPSGFVILTPDARLSQYFLGVDFNAADVSAALDRAAEGKTGNAVFNLMLVCARGLGVSGRYGRLIWIVLEVSVVATVFVVFGGIAWMLRQEKRQHSALAGSDAQPPITAEDTP